MKPVSRSTLAILAALAAALALPALAPTYYVQFAAKALLMGLLALSLNLVVGFGGLVSLCHAAFFGLAGYVLGLVTPEGEGASIWWSLPAAMAAAGLVAAAIGALSLRTRGIYFIMVTLAFGEMLFYLFHDTQIGGGSDGLNIYFKPEVMLAGRRLIDLDQPVAFYYVALACLVAGALFVGALTKAPFGRALVAARDNERRASALGYPVFRIRLTAFVLSAMMAAAAGYFSAAQFGFVAPQMLGWHLSATVLVMVVLGGMNSVLGPVVGALVLLGLEEGLKAAFEHWKLIKGLIIIALVFAAPGGLRQLFDMLAPTRAAPEPSATEPSAHEAASHG